MERIRIVTNCHPNEMVAKRVGELTANALLQRGRQVELVEMAEFMVVDKEPLPWYQAFSFPGMATKRLIMEETLASSQEVLAVSFHDSRPADIGMKPGEGIMWGIVGNFRLMLVELIAPYRWVYSWDRVEIVARAIKNGVLAKDIFYIYNLSDLDNQHSQPNFDPKFINNIARLIEDVAAGKQEADYKDNLYRESFFSRA